MTLDQFFIDGTKLRFPKSTLEGVFKGLFIAASIAVQLDFNADTCDIRAYQAVSYKILMTYILGISLGALCGKLGEPRTEHVRLVLFQIQPDVLASLRRTHNPAEADADAERTRRTPKLAPNRFRSP